MTNVLFLSQFLAQVFPLICLSVVFLTFGLLLDPDFQKQKWVTWASGVLGIICLAAMGFIKQSPGVTNYDWAIQALYIIPLFLSAVIFCVTLYTAHLIQDENEEIAEDEVKGSPYIAPEIREMAHDAANDTGGKLTSTVKGHTQKEEAVAHS